MDANIPSRAPNEVQIVKAEPGDATLLTQVAMSSKRHWRYPESWMSAWKDKLAMKPESIRRNEVYKAMLKDKTIGFYALAKIKNGFELIDFWVLPDHMGQGVGRRMFMHAVRLAQSLGAEQLEIESDPNAEGFYLRMGAHRIGQVVSEIEGQRRELPLLLVDLRKLQF